MLTTKTESANANLASPQKARAAPQPDIKASRRIGRDENMPSPQKPKALENHNVTAPPKRPRGRPPAILQKQKRTSQSIGAEEATPKQLETVVPQDSPFTHSRESLSDMSDPTGASRPSRRRGAVVSYAEPNLRVKMRRPSKQMADAVADRRSSTFQEGDQLDENQTNASPHLSSDGHPLAGLVLPDVLSKDGSSDQLLATVSRRKRKVSSTNKEDRFFSTSVDQDDNSTTSREPVASQRQSRRHSSNPKSKIDLDDSWSSQADSSFDNDEPTGWKLPPAIDAGHRRETRVGARRRSMMV